MKYLLLFLLCLLGPVAYAQSPRDVRDFLVQWEGYTTYVVTRSNGEKVVGVGHNMRYPAPLIAGKTQYTKEELDQAFTHDLDSAMHTARKGVANYEALPHSVKLVTLSLIWTVGPTGFMAFRDYRAALERSDFKAAAYALDDSLWARQVGNRRKDNHIQLLMKSAR